VRWGFTGHRPTRSAVQAVADRGRLDWLVGTSARFAIVDVASGRLAGELTMRLPGPPQVGLIGYTVHPQFRGRGYTTRALRLLTDWAFGAAGFARLELGAKSGNVASQRAAASAGFLPDGVRRGRLRTPDGSFDDEARYFLLNPAVDSSDSAESEPAAASDVSPSRISP
jgi:RimJ/RimL family protein N-acetyltransferase